MHGPTSLVIQWLTQHLTDGKSPYTLQTERAALQLFFDDRTLAEAVHFPRRERAIISRSRHVVAHDKHFQPANWQPLLGFLRATGLRRQEVHDLRYRDIYQGLDRRVYVHVENGKGGRQREVPVLPDHEQAVLSLMIANHDPDAHVFGRIPRHLDVHSYRRGFAQALYLFHAPGPSSIGRLLRSDYDHNAVEQVTHALGHNRIDVVLRHYIR